MKNKDFTHKRISDNFGYYNGIVDETYSFLDENLLNLNEHKTIIFK